MLLPFDGRDKIAEATSLLEQLLEVEKDRLAIIIDAYGMDSKEGYLQSQLVDKLVVRYMRSMNRS
ncbi:MAG: hypothetical protein NUK65_09780 [Firmicutes bacterium]|nr:hypothetical protein [Bacillota bacterium]